MSAPWGQAQTRPSLESLLTLQPLVPLEGPAACDSILASCRRVMLGRKVLIVMAAAVCDCDHAGACRPTSF